MITENMLADMRASINELMPDTCDILSLTATADGQGGVSQTWAASSTNVKCRLDVISKREATTGGAVQQFTGYVLSLPYDTTINDTDRVEIDDITYAVTGLNDGQSWKAVKRVMLEAV